MSAHLDKAGLLAITHVLIMADHGEEFLDHAGWGHGQRLYPETLLVPAVLLGPGLLTGEYETDIVENNGVAPTIASLVKIPAPRICRGRPIDAILGEGAIADNSKASGVRALGQGYSFSRLEANVGYRCSV